MCAQSTWPEIVRRAGADRGWASVDLPTRIDGHDDFNGRVIHLCAEVAKRYNQAAIVAAAATGTRIAAI
jgi:hypothetical protein